VCQTLPKSKIKAITWQTALPSSFELNVVGASKGNPGLSGNGGIIPYGHGRFFHAFAKAIGTATNMEVELLALIQGFNEYAERGF
jgi:ribonuclease HI